MEAPMGLSRSFIWETAQGDDLFAIPLPFDPKTVFGKTRVPVIVTIGGHSYRSTITSMGGSPWVPFRKSNRAAAGVADHGAIEVTLTLDEEERTVEVPGDLAIALTEADVMAHWDKLSFTARHEHVEGIEGAAKPETRARRLAKAVAAARAKGA